MSFPKPTDEDLDLLQHLASIAFKVRGDEIQALEMRIKRLRTEALNRERSWRRVGDHYAKNCILCHGTNLYHYCMNPYCQSNNMLEKDDCLHFTPEELEKYEGIQKDYLQLLHSIHHQIESGILPKDLLVGKTTPSDAKEWN